MEGQQMGKEPHSMKEWHDKVVAQLREQHGKILSQLEQQHQSLLHAVAARCAENTPTPLAVRDDDVPIHLGEEETRDCEVKETEAVAPAIQKEARHPQRPSALRRQGSQSKDVPGTWLAGVVNSRSFEVCSLTLIVIQIIVLVIEAQLFSSDLRCDVDRDCNVGERLSDNAAFKCFEIMFIVAYTLEALLRVVGDWRWAVFSGWWWFDLLLVAVGWPACFVTAPLTVSGVRTIRVCRILRFANEMDIPGLETFCFLLRSVRRCMKAAIWSFVVLLLITTTVGLFIQGIVETRINDGATPYPTREWIYRYFGSFTRTLLTMFEITIGNWIPVCRFMVENLDEWWTLFFILYQCMFCFAVVRIIAALFIAETNRLATLDDQEAIVKAEKQRRVYLDKLKHVFIELDTSGDGKISWSEFEVLLTEPRFRVWMATLEIPVDDLKTVFAMLDDGTGVIDFAAFTTGVMRFKGQAKSIDLVQVQLTVAALDRRMAQLLQVMGRHDIMLINQPVDVEESI